MLLIGYVTLSRSWCFIRYPSQECKFIWIRYPSQEFVWIRYLSQELVMDTLPFPGGVYRYVAPLRNRYVPLSSNWIRFPSREWIRSASQQLDMFRFSVVGYVPLPSSWIRSAYQQLDTLPLLGWIRSGSQQLDTLPLPGWICCASKQC